MSTSEKTVPKSSTDPSAPPQSKQGQDPLVRDAIRSVQELYRLVEPEQPASTALRDLCKDTLLLVNKCGGYPLHDPSLEAEAEILAASLEGRPTSRTGDIKGLREGRVSPIINQSGGGDRGGGRRDSRKGQDRRRTSSFAMAVIRKSAAQGAGQHIGIGRKRKSLFSLSRFNNEKRRPTLPGQVIQDMLEGEDDNGLLKEFLDAPIVDIGAVFGSDPTPDGFLRIATTPYGRKADLNAGAGGHYIYLTIKKDANQRPRSPIVSLALIFPDRKEFVPPTFSVVRRRGEPVDFNAGTNGERVYLCFKRGAGNPIIDIKVLFPRRRETVPTGYTLLERTPFKYEADVNAGASTTTTIFLCYKQRLRHVEQLSADSPSCGYAGSSNGMGGGLFNSNNSSLLGGNVSTITSCDTLQSGAHHGHFNSNRSGPPYDVDDIRSFASSGALNELWAHADLRPKSEELGPILRRTLLIPLITALYVGTGEATAVALREIIMVASRHLMSPPLTQQATRGQCPLQGFVIEALCFFIHRVQAEHFDVVVQYLRGVVQGGTNEDLTSASLQQIYTTCVFLCNFEAFRALENERCEQAAAAKASVGRKGLLGGGRRPLLSSQNAAVVAGHAAGGVGGMVNTLIAAHGPSGTPAKEPTVMGVDCSAFVNLRNLIEVALKRVELAGPSVPPAASSSSSKLGGPGSDGRGSAGSMVRGLLVDMVDGAIQHVELTKATQRAVDCIKRSSSSSHESFWKELLAISELITTCPADENAFLLLAATCKLASEPPRSISTGGDLVERDVASKLVSLELLGLILRKTGERYQHSPLFGCQIRRLVVSCLLANVVTGMQDLRVQRRVLACISCLWRLYRRWCKVEFGLLCDEAMLRVLRFQPCPPLIPRQMAVVLELSYFLEVPQSLVEVYLNFDLDRQSLAVRQPLHAFEEIVASVCGLGEDLGVHLAVRMEDPETRLLHLRTLDTVAQLTRAIMDASGHAHLIPRDAKVRAISLHQQGGGWEPDVCYSSSTNLPALVHQQQQQQQEEHKTPPAKAPTTASSIVTTTSSSSSSSSNRDSVGDANTSLLSSLPKHLKPAEVEIEHVNVEIWDSGGGLGENEEEYLLLPQNATGSSDHQVSSSEPPSAVAALALSSLSSSSRPRPIISTNRTASRGIGGVSSSERRRRILSGDGTPRSSISSAIVPAMSPRQASSVRLRQELQMKQDENLTQALSLYRSKGLKKAIQYLVASSFMSDTPRDIASFLRVYRDLLDPVAIGEFLGEGGNANDAAYWNLLRLSYVSSISFHNMTLEQALRHFLTRCGFRLPGESQKIDRLVSVFAECYFQDNQGMPCCPFSQPLTPYIISFAIIILQTDLHKAKGKRGKGNKKMSKEAFINNLRGVDDSPDLTRAYLSEIYDSISTQPIEMTVVTMGMAGEGHGVIGANGLSGEESGEGEEAVEGGGGGAHHGGCGKDPLGDAWRGMVQSVREADELLQGLAVYPTRFSFVGINANLTPDLVRLMFEAMWFHVHSLVHSVLHNATQSDPEAIMTCLDIVQYAISASMFLNLRSQQQVFATLLSKFKQEQERASYGAFSHLSTAPPPPPPSTAPHLSGSIGIAAAGGGGGGGGGVGGVKASSSLPSVSLAEGGLGGTAVGSGVEQDLSDMTAGSSSALKAIGQVHSLISDLKESVQQSRMREELKAVAKRIDARAKLLEGSRRFIREGDLTKKCRSGKSVTYRFFLFSDQLLYTHRGFGGEYKIHAQLLLSLTKLSNVDDRRNCSFQINHPRKSFIVVAESPEMKRVWMRDINEAKAAARKGVVERQLSIISRLRLESDRVMSVLQEKQEEPPLFANKMETIPSISNKLVAEEEDDGDDLLPTKALSLHSNPSETSPLIVARGSDGGGAGGGGGGKVLSKSISKAYSRSSSSTVSSAVTTVGEDKERRLSSSAALGCTSSAASSFTAAAAAAAGVVSTTGTTTGPGEGRNAYATPGRQLLRRTNTGGSRMSSTSIGATAADAPSYVELENTFADGLRALQKLLRGGGGGGGGGGGDGQQPTLLPNGGAIVAGGLSEQAKGELIGYFLQYREGDCPSISHLGSSAGAGGGGGGGEVAIKKLRGFSASSIEAWRSNVGMSETLAMTKFLMVLDAQVPGWREEGSLIGGTSPFKETMVKTPESRNG